VLPQGSLELPAVACLLRQQSCKKVILHPCLVIFEQSFCEMTACSWDQLCLQCNMLCGLAVMLWLQATREGWWCTPGVSPAGFCQVFLPV
jgi:hypothetical protein